MLAEVHVDLNKNFYIFHPKLQNPHRYLHHFMDFSPLVYVRLEGESLSFSDVIGQVRAACLEQTATGLLSDVAMLILDDGDRATRSALEAIPAQLLFDCGVERLALLSRYVPRTLFSDDDLRDQIQLVPVDESLMLYDYCALPNKDGHLLEVTTFGEGTVYVDGERVKLETVGTLPRSLLFYLLDRRICNRNEIFSVFWPTMSEDRATNVFHVTKRKIHDLVGVELTEYSSRFYRIASELDVRYDVDVFRERVQAAQTPDAQAVEEKLEAALNLYHNHFLTSMDGIDWVQKRRAELKDMRVEVCTDLARRYLKADRTQAALGLYLQAYADNMAREDIVAHIMRLYLQTGRGCDAVAIYERLRQRLLEDLDVQPAKVLRDLSDEAEAACFNSDS